MFAGRLSPTRPLSSGVSSPRTVVTTRAASSCVMQDRQRVRLIAIDDDEQRKGGKVLKKQHADTSRPCCVLISPWSASCFAVMAVDE
jgi:hypothetical protein